MIWFPVKSTLNPNLPYYQYTLLSIWCVFKNIPTSSYSVGHLENASCSIGSTSLTFATRFLKLLPPKSPSLSVAGMNHSIILLNATSVLYIAMLKVLIRQVLFKWSYNLILLDLTLRGQIELPPSNVKRWTQNWEHISIKTSKIGMSYWEM